MKFFLKSYGCQMNSYDSELMANLLLSKNYIQTDDISEANVLIFNTCSIREKADEKLFSDLGRANLVKNRLALRGQSGFIIVAGCVAQSQSASLGERVSYIDAIVGPQEIHHIADIIEEINNKNSIESSNPIVMTKLNSKEKFSNLNNFQHRKSSSGFLTIQEGCNNFCTYCIVPYSRGREYSRDIEDVLSEARNLTNFGVREITLLGQNVNSYLGKNKFGQSVGLAYLMYRLAEIDGLDRIRYLTSNPKDIDEDIAKAHGEIEKMMPFVHLPAQSGSDEILAKMNRKYTVAEYVKSVELLKKYRSDIALSSDFIVGFPGETDEDFRDTMNFIANIGFSQAYSFKYSPRPKTPAAKMINQVEENVKINRLQELQDLTNKQQNQFNANFDSKTLSVLFEKEGRNSGQLIGRSEYYQAVSANGDKNCIGKIFNVTITDIKSHSLFGVILK